MRPRSPTNSGLNDDVHMNWMVHFVSARNPHDRGFAESEGGTSLPADFELSKKADEFEVLCRQMILGGLIPGWPDGFCRRLSPRPAIVAQSVEAVDFARRSSLCGVVFSRADFERAGAMADIIPGRQDLHFEDLLAWDVRCGSADWIEFRAPPDGGCSRTLGLPLHLPESPFGSIGVMVDDEEQAEIIQGIVTSNFLGLRSGVPTDRLVRRRLLNAFVLVPAIGRHQGRSCRALGSLESFVTRPAVVPSEQQLRIKVRVERAVRLAMDSIAPYMYPLGSHQSASYLAFAAGSDAVSEFLTATSWASFAERGAVPGDWRLNIDIGADCPCLEVAATFLASALGLHFYVGQDWDRRP